MSRARSIKLPNGERTWFDVHRNGEQATSEQLELLATVETDCDLDDLLDESLTQGEVISRLRKALGQGPIPISVYEKRQKWRQQRQVQPACRKCGKVGDSTKHHFVNKWMLRELEHYTQRWADRSQNCIPLCITCHRDFHARSNGPMSIVPYLDDEEKEFAQRAIRAFLREKPHVFELIIQGDDSVYECRLLRDWAEGSFKLDAADNVVIGRGNRVGIPALAS